MSDAEHPGRAYLTRTGVPADASNGLPTDELERRGGLRSAQRLVNDNEHNPLTDARTNAWVRERAARDLTRR